MCLSISVGAYFCWLCLTDTQDELHDSYKCKVILALGECGSHYRLCVPPCKRKAFSAGDTHSLCVVCLRAEQAESALEGADCPCKNKKGHCVLALGGVLWVRAFTCILHGAGPFRGEQGGALAALVGIADGSGGRHEDGWVLIFFFSHQIQRPLSGFGSPPCGPSPRREGSTLCLPSSEEVDVEDVDELCNQQALFHEMLWTRERSARYQPMGILWADCAPPRRMISRFRSRCCWGTVTTEIAGRCTWIWQMGWRRARIALFASPPALLRSSALTRGWKPRK